jgi:hypothetical protein
MNLRALAPAAFAALLAVTLCALAQDTLLGRWRDNAPGSDPIGTLVIGNGSISVGRLVTYRVRPVAAFGDGRLFEVLGLNRKRDPEGCGPDGKVRYLAVQPLPPSVAGVADAAIRVFFYSGASPPTVESIETDVALCSVRPFGR